MLTKLSKPHFFVFFVFTLFYLFRSSSARAFEEPSSTSWKFPHTTPPPKEACKEYSKVGLDIPITCKQIIQLLEKSVVIHADLILKLVREIEAKLVQTSYQKYDKEKYEKGKKPKKPKDKTSKKGAK